MRRQPAPGPHPVGHRRSIDRDESHREAPAGGPETGLRRLPLRALPGDGVRPRSVSRAWFGREPPTRNGQALRGLDSGRRPRPIHASRHTIPIRAWSRGRMLRASLAPRRGSSSRVRRHSERSALQTRRRSRRQSERRHSRPASGGHEPERVTPGMASDSPAGFRTRIHPRSAVQTSKPQPIRKATPPIGVTAPSQRCPVSTSV